MGLCVLEDETFYERSTVFKPLEATIVGLTMIGYVESTGNTLSSDNR